MFSYYWLTIVRIAFIDIVPQTPPKNGQERISPRPLSDSTSCSRCTVLICNFGRKAFITVDLVLTKMWVFVTFDISNIKRTILEINSLRYNHLRMRSERQKTRGVIYVISLTVSEISHRYHEWKLVLGRSCFCTIVKVLNR